MSREIILIVHNVRSTHNVGSLFRTSDAMKVGKVYLTGYTPYPVSKNDPRLPHVAARANQQIAKTALGAEKTVNWSHLRDIKALIKKVADSGFLVAALEQGPKSVALSKFHSSRNIALIVGNEVDGLDEPTLKLAEVSLEIPMLGQKESLNVASAAAVALYHLRFNVQ